MGARHIVTTCAAHRIAITMCGTTLFVLLGLGASTTMREHAIVYLKVRHCRIIQRHGLGIPCMAPIVKKSGTKCQELYITMMGKKKNCFGAEGEECTKECNWRHAHWCYVEKGCTGLQDDDIIVSEKSDDLAKGVQLTKPSFNAEVGYSYAMCHYANCDEDHFDDNPECPFGEKCLTCGMVKYDFKAGGCCGHPEKHIIIHHLYHDIGEFPHHHHFPHDEYTHHLHR